MTKQKQRKSVTQSNAERMLAVLTEAIQGRGPADALVALSTGKHADDAVLLTATAVLCALDRDGPQPASEYLAKPLDCIAEIRSPLTERILFKFSSTARMADLRVEAIRRLGRVARTNASLDLLNTCASSGDCRAVNYQGHNVDSVAFRSAAIESLGMVAVPRQKDFDCLLGLAAAEAERGDRMVVFEDCTISLGKTARPADLEKLIELAKKCHRPEVLRCALSACAGVPSRFLARRAADLGLLMLRAVQGDERNAEIVGALEKIAPAIATRETVRQCGEQCARLCLDNGLGRVAARLLESYQHADETLANAYLAFAQTEENTRQGSACIQGLARCAARPDMVGVMLNRFVVRDTAGYRSALELGTLREVVPCPDDLIEGLCSGLDEMHSDNERRRPASLCCDGFVQMALAERVAAMDSRRFGLKAIRDGRQQQGAIRERLNILLQAVPTSDIFGALVARIMRTPPSAGCLSLTACLLQECDEISQAVLLRLISEAGKLQEEPNCFGVVAPPLIGCESIFWAGHQAWLRKQVDVLICPDGRLNRYLLDAMRRHDVDLVGTCQLALARVQDDCDADFVLESMALRNDHDFTRRIADYITFSASKPELGVHIRKQALGVLARKLANCEDGKLIAEVLTKVHGCFEDVPPVRLAAYACCGGIANPASIGALRHRFDSDRSKEGKDAVRQALATIRKRLVDNRPTPTDAKACAMWLGHVGSLGEPDLLDHIGCFLHPPHPEESVRISAIKAVELIGNESGAPLLRTFITTVSPSGAVLAAAQHAIARLEGRKDLDLREILAEVMPPDSPVLDLQVNYEVLLGLPKVKTIARGLREAVEMLRDHRWDHCVTAIDGVCDVLCRVAFDKYHALLGMDAKKGSALAQQDYGSRVRVVALASVFPSVQPQLVAIHDLRGLATTAHLEGADGIAKPGLAKHDAEHALAEFKHVFPRMIAKFAETSRLGATAEP